MAEDRQASCAVLFSGTQHDKIWEKMCALTCWWWYDEQDQFSPTRNPDVFSVSSRNQNAFRLFLVTTKELSVQLSKSLCPFLSQVWFGRVVSFASGYILCTEINVMLLTASCWQIWEPWCQGNSPSHHAMHWWAITISTACHVRLIMSKRQKDTKPNNMLHAVHYIDRPVIESKISALSHSEDMSHFHK